MNLSHLHFYLEDRFYRKLLAIFPKNAISLFEALTTLLYLAFLTSFFLRTGGISQVCREAW